MTYFLETMEHAALEWSLVPLFPDGLFGSDYYSCTAESVLWHTSPLQSATRLPHWL